MSMQQQIEDKLTSAFSPTHLEVVNETHMHNVPANNESHYKVTLVSDKFADLMLIKQHRLVNAELKTELDAIHALALHTYTPEKWLEKNTTSPESPLCHGGSSAKNAT